MALEIVSFAFVLLGALAVTFALLKRRVLDLEFALSRTLVVAVVSLIVVMSFVLLEWLLGTVLAGVSPATGLIANARLALALGVSLQFIHKRVDAFVDAVLFRKRHDDERALRDFSKEAAFVTESDALLDRAIENVRPFLEAADPDWFSECIKSGFGSGEAIITDLGTCEKTSQKKKDEDEDDDEEEEPKDNRALVFEPEFGRQLTINHREGSIASQILRQAWDDGHLQLRHSKSRYVAEDAHVSILAHVTHPKCLRRKLQRQVSGRMLERKYVRFARRGPRRDRTLAQRLQHRAAASGPRTTDARRVRAVTPQPPYLASKSGITLGYPSYGSKPKPIP